MRKRLQDILLEEREMFGWIRIASFKPPFLILFCRSDIYIRTDEMMTETVGDQSGSPETGEWIVYS